MFLKVCVYTYFKVSKCLMSHIVSVYNQTHKKAGNFFAVVPRIYHFKFTNGFSFRTCSSLNSLHKNGKTKDHQCFQYTQTIYLRKSRPTAKSLITIYI